MKDYSSDYMKNNRSSSLSVRIAAFISALLLSLLCGLFYNAWKYEVERIQLEEGGWHSRIIGEFTGEDMENVKNFANVKDAVVNEKGDKGGESILDIYFDNMDSVFSDTRRIAVQIGAAPEKIVYNYELLALYLIRDSSDPAPRLLFPMFILITLLASFSLIMIIHNSFAVSMNARIHQFGIFSSIGATPKQIRICLLQEALALSIVPIISGSLIGIAGSFGLNELINLLAKDISGRHVAVFQYHPFVFAVTIFSSILTIFFSAEIPAKKLSRLTPLEAIRSTGSLQLKKRKHSRILSLLFGVKGELAGNALKVQKKSLRISTVSLLLSFLGFSIMLCFTTLSGISTRYTYFERYQNAWDIMITIKDTKISDFNLTDEVKTISGTGDVTVYQKAEAMGILSEDWQSDELTMLGGLDSVMGKPKEKGKFHVKIPIVVLDDASFLEYCSKVSIPPSLDGAIILNQIWDSINSNFRYKQYIPFVKEDRKTTTIYNASTDNQFVEIPILSYTQTAPVLREEYRDYGFVHFIPMARWKAISGQIDGSEPDSYIRVFSNGNADLTDLNNLEKEIIQRLEKNYKIESENRIQEKISNDRMMKGMMMIFGAFCVLLAIIGIANVFSNTLGFLRQRKREFAQYMSIGLTPQEMQKIFCIEALVIAGKPLLITLPLTVLFVQFAVTKSYLEPMVFWSEAPILTILVFAAAIIFFIALAYYIGGKRLLRCNLNETLRNDTLV